MTNTQGNLFEQTPSEPANNPSPADAARLELTPEAAKKRRLEKEARERRTKEAAQKRQDRIERAAEHRDLRTHEEIRQASAEQGLAKAREELDKTTPQPDVNN